jgi:riboflavin kinase / FMN adenylyltransferase
MGAASVGVRPTVKTNGKPLLEVFLMDFQGNLYGRRIVVEFVERIRAEEKFDSLDIMTAQMHRDINAVRAVFAQA